MATKSQRLRRGDLVAIRPALDRVLAVRLFTERVALPVKLLQEQLGHSEYQTTVNFLARQGEGPKAHALRLPPQNHDEDRVVITPAQLLEVQRGLCAKNTAQVKVLSTGEVFRIKRHMLEAISDDEMTRLKQRRVSLMDKTLG